MKLIYTIFLILTLLVVQNASAKIIEEQIKTAVKVKNVYGREIEREVISHVIRDSNAKSPILIYNHGRGDTSRSATAPNFISRFSQSRFFLEYGFAIVSPTRIGYGVTGGQDLEDNDGQRFSYETAQLGSEQVLKVIDHLKEFDWADTSNVIVLGISVGGMVAMHLATSKRENIKLVINFAGGAGGDPVRRPGQPTRSDLVAKTFDRLGKENIHFTHWFYSINDKYWGEQYPKEWFSSFEKGGGKGKFYSLPAINPDGHVVGNILHLWRDDMIQIIESLGYRKTVGQNSLINDFTKVPFLRDTGRDAYKVFLDKGSPRAFAINEFGFFGWAWGANAKERALENCNKRMPNTCRLYAVDDEVIWNNK